MDISEGIPTVASSVKLKLVLPIDLIPGCVVSALFMKSMDEQILRATKEIVVKFIELGRLSPSNVHESIRDIHATIRETVRESMDRESTDQE